MDCNKKSNILFHAAKSASDKGSWRTFCQGVRTMIYNDCLSLRSQQRLVILVFVAILIFVLILIAVLIAVEVHHGVLFVLILRDQIAHILIRLLELHLVHALAFVPMQER